MTAQARPGDQALSGRMLDCDSHLMLMPRLYTEVLGEEHGRPLRRWAEGLVGGLSDEDLRDRRAMARGDIWRFKGWLAHGADDAGERLEALDLMGLRRQLVFPPVTLAVLSGGGEERRRARARYNDFVLEWASSSRGRLRPVAQLGLDHPDQAMAEASRLVRAGARAVEVPFSHPPGGRSPADPVWDPMYALLAEAGTPLLLHVGAGGFGGVFGPERSLVDPAWGDTERLRPGARSTPPRPDRVGDTGAFGQFDVVTLHLAAEVFLSALVLGGVFDRHPGMRVGVIELGAQWVSGWVERMDAASAAARYGLPRLAERPSDYVRRQVRVTPHYGEDVGRYVQRDGLREVYAFSTDFPHVEGGKNPVGRFLASLATLGPDAVEAFFVTNGEALLPSAH